MSASKPPSPRLTVADSYDEIAALVDKFYNKPIFTDRFREEDFEKEFFDIQRSIRERLSIFSETVPYGEKGAHLGPIGKDRSIGIVLNKTELFRPELLCAIWEIVSSFNEDYLIYIDGEHETGSGSFSICIKKDEILGYADQAERLRPFGFQV